MAIFRITVIAAIFTALTISLSPAHACDSNYPWTCKPVPSIDPPEAAADAKPAAKPLKIMFRPRAAAAQTRKAVNAAVKAERSAQTSRKRLARKAVTRRWAVRARLAKVAAARIAAEQADVEQPIEQAKIPVPKRRDAAEKPDLRRERLAEGNEPNTGFAAIWAERSAAQPEAAAVAAESGSTEAAADPVAASPIPIPVVASPVPVASQDDINEIDLAAAPAAASIDSFWLRGLFLAFGGLLAVGSALRLFV